ncbi:hypothetical protein ATO10_01970 [Actibacterium atlanticum]|uniref:Uncharacterized protein n=1 Tax=Actibacterium atlanticum TaxID=1461693 RepID=A0A058ZPI2_9RHOB|nr:hypothetical protein [Actibacterium atlanticum]KCV83488.1 hypothetical protein ATO10_01970 [Actibacterium atlanticum]
MTAHSTYKGYGASSAGAVGPWVSVCETNWGFVISSDTQWSNRSVLIERVCAVAGLACLVAACGSWLFPQVNASVPMPVDVPLRLASSLTMAMPALLFLWISDRGMGSEVQIDVVKGCLRRGVCNRRGKFRVQSKVPFSDIASAYIKRGSTKNDLCQLHVRLKGSNKVVYVASGSEATMKVLYDRLNQVLRPVKTKMPGWDRVGRRLLPAGAAS